MNIFDIFLLYIDMFLSEAICSVEIKCHMIMNIKRNQRMTLISPNLTLMSVGVTLMFRGRHLVRLTECFAFGSDYWLGS